MHPPLQHDLEQFPALLAQTQAFAADFLAGLDDRAPGMLPDPIPTQDLPDEGIGAEATLQHFQAKYSDQLQASTGPRYFGFVTGGSTPASVMGDWVVSAVDQNAAFSQDSSAPYIEQETMGFLRQLLGLSERHYGAMVTGATQSNLVGLALARSWVAHQRGVNIVQEGLYALGPIPILSGAAHSSAYKAIAILGMGKANVQAIPTLPNREAVDVQALRAALEQINGPCIVIANAGVVNTGDFDDLQAIADLKRDFPFWLHVDGAFGGVAAASPRFAHLTQGMDAADSICIDAHKWFNVPYDAAMQFSPHRALQVELFQNRSAYLGLPTENPDYVHLTPESSRRLRALPLWFSLLAYGRAGYADIVERCCDLAQQLGQYVQDSAEFELLAPVRLNIVCFTLAGQPSSQQIADFLARVREDGRAFFTPTVLWGKPAIRAAFSNWRTQAHDLDITWEALRRAL
jgi:glutamate/tyrosine decarboxylase-like PLP-dependent enzyme